MTVKWTLVAKGFVSECSLDQHQGRRQDRQRENLGWVVIPTMASVHPIGDPGAEMTFRLFLIKARALA